MPVNMDALMQMISGVGAGLNQQPWTQALNQMVQSGYSSKNQFDLLGVFKQILSGEMPEGKATIGEDGLSLKLPSNAKLVSDMFGGGGESKMGAPGSAMPNLAPGLPGVQTPNVQAPEMPNLPAQGQGGMLSLLNPSVSQLGNISAADLIGLTPKDVSNALSGALNIEELNQRKAMQPIEMMYKGALTTEALARAQKLLTPEDKRTNLVKNYEYAKLQGFSGTLEEWMRDLKTAHVKDYEYAKQQGYEGTFEDWVTDIAALGGGLSLEQKVAQKIALSKTEGETYFSNPKWVDDVAKHMSDKSVRSEVTFSDDPNAKAKEAVKYIESKIAAGKGVVEKFEWADKDKKTIIWTVRWPSGNVETIKHAVR